MEAMGRQMAGTREEPGMGCHWAEPASAERPSWSVSFPLPPFPVFTGPELPSTGRLRVHWLDSLTFVSFLPVRQIRGGTGDGSAVEGFAVH